MQPMASNVSTIERDTRLNETLMNPLNFSMTKPQKVIVNFALQFGLLITSRGGIDSHGIFYDNFDGMDSLLFCQN